MGLIASLGIGQVDVFRRLRVAMFSTGDELRSLGQALDPGCVYDSNRYSLLGALLRLGVEVIDLGLVGRSARLVGYLAGGAATSGRGVTSGGGAWVRRPHPLRAGQHGRVAFWKVAMRPGRPFAFGPLWRQGERQVQAPASWLFALPGNPVAALVTFYALPACADAVAGCHNAADAVLQARCTTAIRKRPGRNRVPAAQGSSRQAATAGEGRAVGIAGRRRPAQHERGQRAAGAAPRGRAPRGRARWSMAGLFVGLT
jgi:molybdopterin molybdotransferase